MDELPSWSGEERRLEQLATGAGEGGEGVAGAFGCVGRGWEGGRAVGALVGEERGERKGRTWNEILDP